MLHCQHYFQLTENALKHLQVHLEWNAIINIFFEPLIHQMETWNVTRISDLQHILGGGHGHIILPAWLWFSFVPPNFNAQLHFLRLRRLFGFGDVLHLHRSHLHGLSHSRLFVTERRLGQPNILHFQPKSVFRRNSPLPPQRFKGPARVVDTFLSMTVIWSDSQLRAFKV